MTADKRKVLVTGAGRDTGRLLAIAFGARGVDVVVTARRLDAAEETAGQIRAASGSATAVELDLTDPSSIEALQLDRLDLLVNNGARYLKDPAGPDDIADTIAVGATGTVQLTERLLPLLRESAAADIVNLISAAGEPGQHRSTAHPAFYAAKHAQAGYAEILSARLPPKASGSSPCSHPTSTRTALAPPAPGSPPSRWSSAFCSRSVSPATASCAPSTSSSSSWGRGRPASA